ncbi:MAG: glycosyltransferase family 2 protein [Planctomycetota bacterium]
MACSITIVMPSLGQGEFIERAIQSVLGQRLAGLQFVVRDGGSGDDTQAILAQYAGQVESLSEPDQGQAQAVNKALAAARGEVIGWLNADDVYYPRTLSVIAEAFASDPQLDVLYGDADYIDAHDRVLQRYPTEAFSAQRLYEHCFLCTPAVFFRRRLVTKLGGLDESLHYCMDYEYWLRLAKAGARFQYLPQTLAGARLHPASKSVGRPVDHAREVVELLSRHLGRVPDQPLRHLAHVLVESRGLAISRHRLLNRLAKAPLGLALAWRYNRRLPLSMLGWQLRWLLRRANQPAEAS